MLIYHYDRLTGRFLQAEGADSDPKDPETYLVPAFATEIEPPAAPEGMFAAFIDGAWGLVAEPEPDEPEPESPEQIQIRLTAVIQRHLDDQARTMAYDNIFTAVTYAEEPIVPKFQIEGAALRAWRSLVWAHGYGVLAAVLAAERAVPTEEDLVAELPVFVPPVIE
ncbi:MAG: hypothetical protein Q8Q80_01515 [Methyloversatilis sp.]|uniref:hypothetical protein n=1 Tax=Methyloversatilis sp. TaxID=2569862 RepID=UPI0027334762|nr:hypothetical protein [Methyloversatilis sp.]MDP3871316.1 hypothetical protein [Methyloversatilis sp.]